MKQKLLLTLSILFFINSYSQQKKIEFQLSLGPTFSIPKTSKLTNSDINVNPEIKTSINIGAFILPSLNYRLAEKTSLDIGLGFYMDRFTIEDRNANVISEGNRSVNQIQTPININFHFGNNNSYLFGIGGFSSFLLSAKEKGESRINSSGFTTGGDIPIENPLVTNMSQNFDNDIKNKYNSVSFGAFIQLKKNISFSTTTNGFLLLKINQNFNSIKNNHSAPGIGLIEFKNEKEPTTINLGIGIEI
ncbi:hypothetical protein [Bizionia sp.]|uniref:hypothetical protein n=1 Tax=Bizionia sp. TaxID=1954480 RepID=UPI003A8E3C03